MITAVDTNVLFDVLHADDEHGEHSRRALKECSGQGRLIACEVVFAEVSSAFEEDDVATSVLSSLSLLFDPMSEQAARAAGSIFRRYRQRGGTRKRVVADFLIAAHATERADRLLTRDRGFFRTYFPTLNVFDPSSQ
ncbi:MAG: PIN domain-containing protein [Myxococcota bacterium]